MERYVNTYQGEDDHAREQFNRLSEILSGWRQGVWLPTFTFATPGDLAVTYSKQEGFYTVIDDSVFFRLNLQGEYTQTTAAGECRISLPFTHYNDLFRETWWAYVAEVMPFGTDTLLYASMRPGEAFAFILGWPSNDVVEPGDFAGAEFDIRFNGYYRIL